MTHIRICALEWAISNYKNKNYDKYEWRLIKSKKLFWFIMNLLALDRNIEIRYFLINFSSSIFKNDINIEFKSSIKNIAALNTLLAMF